MVIAIFIEIIVCISFIKLNSWYSFFYGYAHQIFLKSIFLIFNLLLTYITN